MQINQSTDKQTSNCNPLTDGRYTNCQTDCIENKSCDIVPCKRINSIIEDAYSQLGIRHKATSAELERWFECSLPFTKRINGIVTKVRKIESDLD